MGRVGLLVWLAAILVVASVYVPHATAQGEHGKDQSSPVPVTHGQGDGHAASDDEGVFGYALDLTIWTVVVFLILLWVLSKYAWKPMLEGLQKREQGIHAAMEDAQRARDEAQRIRDELKAEMDRASEKVRDFMDNARRDAQKATDDMLAKTRSEIQTERDRLHREIGMARDQALQELWAQTAQLATLVSAKAIRRQLNPDDHRRLVDEAIGEMRQAVKAV